MGHTSYALIQFEADEEGIVMPKIIHLSDDAHLHMSELFQKENPSQVYIEEK